jgi:hypothetical protein
VLGEVSRLVVEALQASDPAATLRAGLASSASLSPEERAALAGVDPDALLLTRLLVAKLRFERLLQGDPSLRPAFEADPAAFTERFRAYDRAVPPATCWPADEAAAFRSFLERG